MDAMRILFIGAVLLTTCAPLFAEDNYLAAQRQVCAGYKDAVDFPALSHTDRQSLRDIQRYREQAKTAMAAHPRLSWLGLSPDERCEATFFQRRESRTQQWFDKRASGIGW